MSEINIEIGTKVKLGKNFINEVGLYDYKAGDVIVFIEGFFEHENGLYCQTVSCPSILNESDDEYDQFDSMYHIFGNDFEHFMDCEIIVE